MSYCKPGSIRKLIPSFAWRRALLTSMVFVVIGALIAYGQAPPANSTVGNQATFTFDDGSGTSRTGYFQLGANNRESGRQPDSGC